MINDFPIKAQREHKDVDLWSRRNSKFGFHCSLVVLTYANY